MANKSIELLKAAFLKRKLNPSSISPQAEEICSLLDHFRYHHCFDRDQYDKLAKQQAEEIAALKSRLAKLEGKGQNE